MVKRKDGMEMIWIYHLYIKVSKIVISIFIIPNIEKPGWNIILPLYLTGL